MSEVDENVKSEGPEEEHVSFEEALVILAKEVEKSNPIDWLGMDGERDIVYSYVAGKVADYLKTESFSELTGEQKFYSLVSSIVNLSIQTFLYAKRDLETADDLK